MPNRLPSRPPRPRDPANFNDPFHNTYLSAVKLAAMIALLCGVAFVIHLGWS